MTVPAVVVVGAGPAASSLLERISANTGDLLDGRPLRVHLVDPNRAGTGRVWRADNHPGLWMNSLAEDVTMFTDDSVVCDGPIWPGPSLYEWASTVDHATLAKLDVSPEVATELRTLRGTTFPTRRVQSAYLDWFHRRVLAGLPPEVTVETHRATVIDVLDAPGGGQLVILDDGGPPLHADAVVFALGHLDAEPDESSARRAEFARANGLVHISPGHTAELDLSAIPAGADVIALGFGQAFTDLVVLLTEGRGGRFVEAPDGSVEYAPSGDEPVLHVGSRRGVPYRSKIDYRLQGPPAPLPHFLDDAAIGALLARDGELDFRADVLPLILREIDWAYYHELFHAFPERTALAWEEFAAAYESASTADLGALIERAVPDPADRFDLHALDRPLAGRHFDSGEALHDQVRAHVAADVARRTDPAFSADLGAFNALLVAFGALTRITAASRLSIRSQIEDLSGWWFSFFMYYASGPPPARLRQLLALERAGLVRFIGAHTTIDTDEARGTFRATSSSHPDVTNATVLVESTVALPSLSRAASTLLQRLRDRGDILEEVVTDGAGWSANTGKVVVDGPACQLVDRDGRRHPARYGLGAFTSRPSAGAFSRPRTNAPSFRQHDLVARAILDDIATRRAPLAAPASSAVA